jgi:hypothetical protein
MAKDAIVSEDMAKKFATEKETPYTRWVKSEGLEIQSAIYQYDLHTIELKDWPRRGGGASSSTTTPRALRTTRTSARSLREGARAAAPALRGDGVHPRRARLDRACGTTPASKVTFEWKKGRDIRDPPQHHATSTFNGLGQGSRRASSRSPTRHRSSTPSATSTSSSDTKYDFEERFNGEPDYFANKGEQKGLLLDTNFVADAINLPLIAPKDAARAAGTSASAWPKGLDELPHLPVPHRHRTRRPTPTGRAPT